MDDTTVRKWGDNFHTLRWSLIAVFFIFNILLIFTYKNPALLALDSFAVTSLIFVIVLLHAVGSKCEKKPQYFSHISVNCFEN
jgi:putative membrane protein